MGNRERTERRLVSGRVIMCVAWLVGVLAVALPAQGGAVPSVISTELRLDRAGSPWTASTNVTVRQGGTLIVEAGAIVEFTGNWLLTAEGSTGGAIIVQGAPYDSAYFRPASGVSEWKGIYISGGTGSSFDYGVVLNASKGLNLNASNARITHCAFRRCRFGIWCTKSSPAITSCWVSETSQAGILCEHSSGSPISQPVIFDCNLFDNAAHNVFLLGYGSVSVTIMAEWNWWGTTDPTEIAESIYDGNDTSTQSFVDYNPWRSQVPVDHRTWGSIKALFRD